MPSSDNSNPGADGSSSSSSNPFAAAAEGGDSQAEVGEGTLPQLPEASNDSSIPSIKLGESITLEEMGPIIINSDGTTRAIDNWDQMTKGEQEVAWRRISQRNEKRRKALLEQQQQKQGETEMEGKEEEQQS